MQREAQFLLQSPEEIYRTLLEKDPKLIQNIPLKYIASYIGITPQALSKIRKRIFWIFSFMNPSSFFLHFLVVTLHWKTKTNKMNFKMLSITFMMALVALKGRAQDSDYKTLIKAATQAPSGHNSQPWWFETFSQRWIVSTESSLSAWGVHWRISAQRPLSYIIRLR